MNNMAISNRSGKYFVAYKGQDLSKSIIEDKLERKNRSDSFSIKTLTDMQSILLDVHLFLDITKKRWAMQLDCSVLILPMKIDIIL